VKYVVETVDESELPQGVSSVVVEREGMPPLLLVSGDVAKCWRMMRAWEDVQEPEWQPSVSIPLRLVV
jgi:hypothetical protein